MRKTNVSTQDVRDALLMISDRDAAVIARAINCREPAALGVYLGRVVGAYIDSDSEDVALLEAVR